MIITGERDQMCKFINHLVQISNRMWRECLDEKETFRETYNGLVDVGLFYPLNRPRGNIVLDKFLERDHVRVPDDEDGTKKMRIVLPPIERASDFVPLLSIDWNFRNRSERDKFGLDMAKNDKKVISMRFDRGSPGSNHDFFHVQLNSESKGIKSEADLSWLCDTRPCIPLTDKKADHPVSLLILLYGSLYGFETFIRDFHGSGVDPRLLHEARRYL